MNEKTNKAGATSGQNVPKSPNGAPTKFVGRGGATERADFGGGAAKGAKAKFATTKFRHKSQQEQTAASKLRMEKRSEKLEKAKEKLAKQKPPKPPGPVRRVAGTVGGGVHGYVHGKIFEVEQDNVGTEGAHRSELVGESALRHGKRFVQKKIHQGHGGLSLPHGRPGAPGNAGQRPVPADPEAENQAAICQTSTGGRQARGQGR